MSRSTLHYMKRGEELRPTSVKFRPEDKKIIAALQKKMGVADVSNIVRQALRALAAKEGVNA